MNKLFLSSMIFILALSLVMVSSVLAGPKVDMKRVGDIEDPQGPPKKDLMVYDGYTSKDHNSFEPPPANDFTIGVDELNCNVFFACPKSANFPFEATYILILKRLDKPDVKKFKSSQPWLIDGPGKYCWTFFWNPCPDWPGQWVMIPIVISSSGSHIPFNPNAVWQFSIHP
jgi:hypothetical protein